MSLRNSCCDICDIRSVCKQLGRTTGRLGSTGLRAMPLEGRQSRHSGAHLQQLPQQGLDTINDDCRPSVSCQRMDLAAAAGSRATCMSWLTVGRCSSSRTRAGATQRYRTDGRELADASVRSTGLGECCKLLDTACAGYLLF
jgi:hypothetical protein